jgi:hypothetical protein
MVVPLVVGSVRVSGVPSLYSRASTISNESSDSITEGPNSTAQFTVTVEIITLTGLDGVLVTDTEAMEGTEGGRETIYN